jgi:hypothetical protein
MLYLPPLGRGTRMNPRDTDTVIAVAQTYPANDSRNAAA